MWRLLRSVYWLCVVVLVSGCSGGGCSGCAGGALTPIPGGYPITPETRIPRAAQIRLTENGLRRVEAIAPGLFGGFLRDGIPVPRSSQNLSGVGRVVICPSGTCRLTVGLTTSPPPLQLAFAGTNQITARARVTVRGTIPIVACTGSCNDNCERSGLLPCVRIASPDISVDTARGSHGHLGLWTAIALRRDTHAERRNYHRPDLVSPTGSGDAVQEAPMEGIEDSDVQCSGSWICFIVNLLRGTIINQFRGQFAQALGPIQEALAQKPEPNPPGCPTGTTARGGVCQYGDMSPVPVLIGTDGQGNLGALLAGFTPGVNASISYLLAAGDPVSDGQVTGGGMTINMFGAMQSRAHNACVPRRMPPAAPMIPEWMALRANTVPGTSTPIDLGIGLSEEFLNHTFFQLWDSGMFCLGVGTSLSQQFSAGTFGALPQLNSIRQVIFPSATGAVAIALRPQEPPAVRVGSGRDINTDPLLRIALNRVALDFYVWSEERFVRIMTVTTNLALPINLQPDADGLRPTLGMITFADTVVTNTDLLSNSPAQIGTALQGLLGPALSMATGNINPVSLPSINIPGSGGTSLGAIQVRIPAMGGVAGVTEGSSRFLGIFANLEYRAAGARPDVARLDTEARLDEVTVDPTFFRELERFRLENLPRATFTVSTPNDFGRAVEYSYRVDRGTWSVFSRETTYAVQDPAFMAQGRHTIEVRARMAGEPQTADDEPAVLAFVVDTVAPELTARLDGDAVVADATDAVSSAVEYAFQFGDGARTAWSVAARAAVPEGVTTVRVFARDASGNTTETVLSRTALIRGGRSTDDAGGCGCSVAGARTSSRASLAGLAALCALLVALTSRLHRRGAALVAARAPRRPGRALRRVAHLALAALAALFFGCASTDGTTAPTCMEPERACGGRCVAPTACGDCMPGFMSAGEPTLNPTTCMWEQSSCRCERMPALSPGAVGSHLDMATAADGAVWLSAYSPGNPSSNQPYGDLVVGRWMNDMVSWTHVDGVPSSGMVGGDPDGWRGGVVTPGDDVGRFTSIALTAMGQPRVAYWDATNNKLKFAAFNGTAWATHTVDMGGANGRYASLVLLPGDVPAVAYRASAVMEGVARSVVRLARANNANPTRPADWTVTEVAAAASQCRAADCPTGTVCRQDNGRCEMPGGACMPACGSGSTCVGGMCREVYGPTWVEALGPGAHYTRLVVDGMGRPTVVWYDRDRGNLMLASADMTGRFGAPAVLDGEGAMRRDTGDRGIYVAAAFARDGVLHLAYVDGWEERLMYLRVRNGSAMGAPEVIDDGTQVGAMTFDDGKHIVGDGAAVQVAMDGTVRVAYQDTTAGTLRLATRGMMGWERRVLDERNHTGYWAAIDGDRVATYWRDLRMVAMRQWGVRVLPLR